MFNKNDHKNMLFIDIETTTITKEIGELPEALQTHFMRKAEWYLVNEYKIDLENAVIEDYQLVYQEKGPIFPEFAKIVCISVGGYNENNEFKKLSFYDEKETQLLTKFTNFLHKKEEKTPAMIIVGYNIMSFDIPFIIKRLIINEIEVPNIIKIYDKKPWDLTARFKDIFLLWNMGSKNFISFDLLCNILNINSPKTDMNGSMVYSYYYELNRMDSIVNYCESDIQALSDVVQRLTE
jgi:predicted PolB exonuclease-like 3'-5' exonuclease